MGRQARHRLDHDLSHFAGLEEVPVFRAPFSAKAEKLDRVLVDAMVEFGLNEPKGKRMSLMGKMAALTESAADFNKETEATLDGIAEKIAVASKKRDAAVVKHHAYYDAVIKGVDDSVAVIDRLSNGPLGEDGGSSPGKQGG